MNKRIRIDFVSDVSCPWCVIGLKALEAALLRVAGDVTADIHFQPFELNPRMGAAGEDVAEHLGKKYGAAPADLERTDCCIGPSWRAASRLSSTPCSRHTLLQAGIRVIRRRLPISPPRLVWIARGRHRCLLRANTRRRSASASAST